MHYMKSKFIECKCFKKIANLTCAVSDFANFGGLFIILPMYGLYYKSFTIIIYDRNDNGLYYKTVIVANLTMILANLA